MNTKARRCFALTMLVLLCSCTNGTSNKTAEGETDLRKSMEERENTHVAQVADNGAKTIKHEYPPSIPFPQFPDSKIKFSIPPTIEKTTVTVSLESDQSKGKIIGFYKQWFKKNGWKVDSLTSTSGLDSITAQSEKTSASIMAMPDLDMTTIQIIMSTES